MSVSQELICLSTLEQLKSDVGQALLPELVALFISDSTENLDKLQLALQQRDLQALILLSHTLKTVCATYGAQRCHHEARELEMAARGGQWEGIAAGVNLLAQTLPPTMQALELWCHQACC